MGRSLLHRLLGVGKIPRRVKPVLESEGILVADEGIGGSMTAENFSSPRRRSSKRVEAFTGCLVVTGRRLFCSAWGKTQINLPTDDPRMPNIHVTSPETDRLLISFESSDFSERSRGVLRFAFNTDKAGRFLDRLTALGATQGECPGSAESRPS